MRKFISIVIIIMLVIAFGSLLTPKTEKIPINSQISINSQVIKVEIADTDSKRELGLSYRKNLAEKTGMLFIFDEAGPHSFWMKDMLISLDMIFLDENFKIILIEKNISPETFPKYFGLTVHSKYILEIGAGEADSLGFKVGDQAILQTQ